MSVYTEVFRCFCIGSNLVSVIDRIFVNVGENDVIKTKAIIEKATKFVSVLDKIDQTI
jgi:hypothetical protein